MDLEHNFVKLAKVQRRQQTSFNVGLDIHGFGSYENNMAIYGYAIPTPSSSEYDLFIEAMQKYNLILGYSGLQSAKKLAELLAAIEFYLKKLISIYVFKARIFTFKPQSAFYEQFGPAGMVLLSEIRRYIQSAGIFASEETITTLDCKRGDIDTTQGAYFNALIGNLREDFGVDYAPYDFDIINVTPWMGDDVMVLYKKDKKTKEMVPSKGLNLMRAGKGLICVSKSSNPSGPRYQELLIRDEPITLQMLNTRDMMEISKKEDLEYQGLSTIGLVIGSTHDCNGEIRKLFPGNTMLVPGFGAQGGKFEKIILEMISTEQWNGQGAIFSSSRGCMYPFLTENGGSGNINNLEDDAIRAVDEFRKAEKKAYEAENVRQAGIGYPYKMVN